MSDQPDQCRAEFETAISAPPFERDTRRFPNDEDKYAWPGSYRDIDVDLAWHMWQVAWNRQEWRPMATAPRDASRILIHTPRSTRKVQEVWWALEYEGGPGYWQTPPGPGWRGYMILPEAAAGWMPLPAAPATHEPEPTNPGGKKP